MGNLIGFGLRNLLDNHQRYTRRGFPVYLRVKNFVEDQSSGQPNDYVELGIPLAETPAQSTDGTTDILIDPPPTVTAVSWHNIGLSGGRLNFGAQVFQISHTWVKAQMAVCGITNTNIAREVFRNRDGHKAVGLLYSGRMYSIEDITADVVGGEIIAWKLACNSLEIQEDTSPLYVSSSDELTISDSVETVVG